MCKVSEEDLWGGQRSLESLTEHLTVQIKVQHKNMVIKLQLFRVSVVGQKNETKARVGRIKWGDQRGASNETCKGVIEKDAS